MFTVSRGSRVRWIAMFLILSFTTTSLLVPAVEAKVESSSSERVSEKMVSQELDRESSRAIVDQALQREAVRDKLHMLGYTVGEIQERLERLSDEKIQQMAKRIEHVKAGGHLGLEDLDVVVLILLVILAPILAVVWLVLMLVGHDLHLDHDAHNVH